MCNHIWFERGEDKDRLETAARMKKHVDNPNNLPILIFPEGTCVNNTSVMMFKKGSFEVDGKYFIDSEVAEQVSTLRLLFKVYNAYVYYFKIFEINDFLILLMLLLLLEYCFFSGAFLN